MRNVSFQKSVGRLCGAMCDKYDILRGNLTFFQNFLQDKYNSGCHTFLCRVGCRYFHSANKLVCFIINGHRVSKCTADVYANSDLHESVLLPL